MISERELEMTEHHVLVSALHGYSNEDKLKALKHLVKVVEYRIDRDKDTLNE